MTSVDLLIGMNIEKISFARGEEAVRLLEVVVEIVGNMGVLGVRGSEVEVLGMALSTGISAYDASYIVLAGKEGLTLVAEDERLRREASRHVLTALVLRLSNQQES